MSSAPPERFVLPHAAVSVLLPFAAAITGVFTYCGLRAEQPAPLFGWFLVWLLRRVIRLPFALGAFLFALAVLGGVVVLAGTHDLYAVGAAMASLVAPPGLVAAVREMKDRALARRMRRDRREHTALFLHSFNDEARQSEHRDPTIEDFLQLVLGGANETVETLAVRAVLPFARPVALGEVVRRSHRIGAPRQCVEDALWYARFQELASEADVIVMLLGFSPSVAEEMRFIIETPGLRAKTAILMAPPAADKDAGSLEPKGDRWWRWETLRKLGVALPSRVQQNSGPPVIGGYFTGDQRVDFKLMYFDQRTRRAQRQPYGEIVAEVCTLRGLRRSKAFSR
jgi:hypothetical protein